MNSVSLKSVCDVTMGQAPIGTSYNTDGIGVPLLAGAGDFGFDHPEPVKFTDAPTKVAQKGDLILCIRATIGDLNWADKEYCLGRGVAGLRPKNGRLDGNYLWHWLRGNKDELEKKARGSTFKQVSRKDIDELQILLPNNLAEQRRIAAILDKADVIRRKRDQAQALADGFLRSAFLQMFGDPVANPNELESRPLSEIASFVSGATPSKSRKDFWLGNFPWVSPKDMKKLVIDDAQDHVSETVFSETNLKKIPSNTVLIVVRGMILAHTVPIAITGTEVTINQDLKAVVFDKAIDPVFGLWCLKVQHAHLLSKIDTAAHGTKRFDMDRLGSVPITFPSDGAQRKFVSLVQKFSSFLAGLSSATKLEGLLSESLAQCAFRGKL